MEEAVHRRDTAGVSFKRRNGYFPASGPRYIKENVLIIMAVQPMTSAAQDISFAALPVSHAPARSAVHISVFLPANRATTMLISYSR